MVPLKYFIQRLHLTVSFRPRSHCSLNQTKPNLIQMRSHWLTVNITCCKWSVCMCLSWVCLIHIEFYGNRLQREKNKQNKRKESNYNLDMWIWEYWGLDTNSSIMRRINLKWPNDSIFFLFFPIQLHYEPKLPHRFTQGNTSTAWDDRDVRCEEVLHWATLLTFLRRLFSHLS